MGLTISLDQDRIDKGESKQIKATPKDNSGSAITPTTLTADITLPDGTTVNKTKSDFTQSGNDWLLNYTFDQAGIYKIVVEATDSSSNSEKVDLKQRVID